MAVRKLCVFVVCTKFIVRMLQLSGSACGVDVNNSELVV